MSSHYFFTLSKYYIELQQLRFENKFNFKIEIDENIDDEIVNIPPLILQPIVENAIEHGFAKNSGHGKLSIYFKSENKKITVIVENSIENQVVNTNSNEFDFIKEASVSTSLIKEQLNIFNKKLKQKFDLTLTKILDESNKIIGTKAEIILPFNK